MAMTIADRLDSGKIHINEQTVSDEANSPSAGSRTRATARGSAAHANIESFTEIQWLTVRPDIAPYPIDAAVDLLAVPRADGRPVVC